MLLGVNILGLKQVVIKGVSWNLLEQICKQLISVVVTAVLARILSPNDYGLVALSTIFVGFICLFESLSIGSALIQRTNIDDRYISTSFWTSIATGIVLVILLFAIAPFASRYYNQPLLKEIIWASSINILIGPITAIHRNILAKNMKFKLISLINIMMAVASGVSSISLALLGFGVWSLVFGSIIGSIFIIPFVWNYEKWRPKLIFDVECFKDMFGFSSYLLASNIVFYFARNTDKLIVGKQLGANSLGFYTMAYTLMMKPIQQISWAITSVLFPAFSSIQGDIPRIRSAYLRVVSFIAIVTFPMMAGLMVVSSEFIQVLIGHKWLGVVAPLQVLCLVGALQSIGTTAGSIFNSIGRADLQFKTGCISSVGHIAGFFLSIKWGLMALVKVYLLTNIIFTIYTLFVASKQINLPLKDFLLAMKIPIVNSCIMMIALKVYGYLSSTYFEINQYAFLISTVCLGVIVYVSLTTYIVRDRYSNDLVTILRQLFIREST